MALAGYKVLSEGAGWCRVLNQGHVFKLTGKRYTKIQSDVRAETERYYTLFCEVCGETVEVVYSENFESEET